MSLKLLLDEHISPDVAERLRNRQKGIPVVCLAEWEAGRFMGERDDIILAEAARQKLTLVTYDLRTILPLLKGWAETGQNHGGVIFVDQKTISSSDFGGLARALQRLSLESTEGDWKNRIIFLRR